MSRRLFLRIFEGVLIFLCGLSAICIRFAGEMWRLLVGERAWIKLVLSTTVAQGSFYLFDLYDFHIIRPRLMLALRIPRVFDCGPLHLASSFTLRSAYC